MIKWFRNCVLANWKFFAGIIIPLVALPLALHTEDLTSFDSSEEIDDDIGALADVPEDENTTTTYKTLYVVVIMAIFWAFEIIPLAATALIPLVLFPLMGVQSAYVVSQNYTKESNMIFLGGLIVAIGIEYCGLHNRMALKVMNLVGPNPVQLLFGTMAITAFLAMWITATSCVAILVPVVCAIIDEIHESPEVLSNSEIRRYSNVDVISLSPGGPDGAGRGGHRLSGNSGSSMSSPVFNDKRRNTTVFGNNAFSSAPSRGSFFERNTMGRRSSTTNPIIESPKSGRSLNLNFGPNVCITPPTPGHETGNYPSIIFPSLSNPLGKKPSVSNSVSFNVVDEDIDEDGQSSVRGYDDRDPTSTTQTAAEQIAKDEIAKQNKRDEIKKMFLFGMAYAANIGGTAVITGTSPNKIFKEVIKPMDISQGGKYLDITFFTWMALNVPAMLLNIIIAWIYLSIAYYGLPNRGIWTLIRKLFCMENKSEDVHSDMMSRWKTREVRLFLKREYQKLGGITQHEISVAIIFTLVVLLWCFRSPDARIDGWGSLWNSKAGDSTCVMLGVMLLFLLPKHWGFLFEKGDSTNPIKFEPLLDWKFFSSKMPWGYLLLLGSGFAIADASEHSGLSKWMGEELSLLTGLPKIVLLIIVILLTSLLAEFVSNVACANIILPVVASVSRSLAIHPLYITVPAALTCQYAFLFPIATPSNAIVFAAGNFSTIEMVKTGLFLNVICIVVLIVNTITYGNWLFEYSDYEY